MAAIAIVFSCRIDRGGALLSTALVSHRTQAHDGTRRCPTAHQHADSGGGRRAHAAPELPPLLLAQVTAMSARAAELARVDVQAVVVGLLARTTTTLTFRNPHPRPLEGELVFPLPEGATVAGYALDIDGALSSVVVEKQEARLAFESETRRRVDPAWSSGARQQLPHARLPHPRARTRTIRVSYVSELVTEGVGAQRSPPTLCHSVTQA